MTTLACEDCGATGVRLWREYGKFVARLRCRTCLPMEARTWLDHHADPTQAGWWVAAVPSEEGRFWGYTSIPQGALEQWVGMPG